MKSSAVAAIGALGVALSGCATVVDGTSQSIAITTPPTTGAYCTLTSNEGNVSVLTPGVAHVEKSKEDIVAHCSKEGWQDASATIPSDFQGWTVGNLVLGGVVGFGVDALSGAMHKYPHAYEIPMQPISGTAPPSTVPGAVSEVTPQYTPAAGSQASQTSDGVQRFDRWQDHPEVNK
ncbi:MAG TPA: hypothetical protein VHY79_19200 [Rhizomicrobium sp.]|jgi:hypothetical protein|nr:hypothetical protein [Rhizomicrobium sp.]